MFFPLIRFWGNFKGAFGVADLIVKLITRMDE